MPCLDSCPTQSSVSISAWQPVRTTKGDALGPATSAAHLYRFQSVKRRERQLELNANGLVEAGLLEIHPCGCAFLPFHYRDFRQKGGNHSNAVRDFHVEHVGPDESVQVSTGPASESVSGSVEGKEAVSGTESDPRGV